MWRLFKAELAYNKGIIALTLAMVTLQSVLLLIYDDEIWKWHGPSLLLFGTLALVVGIISIRHTNEHRYHRFAQLPVTPAAAAAGYPLVFLAIASVALGIVFAAAALIRPEYISGVMLAKMLLAVGAAYGGFGIIALSTTLAFVSPHWHSLKLRTLIALPVMLVGVLYLLLPNLAMYFSLLQGENYDYSKGMSYSWQSSPGFVAAIFAVGSLGWLLHVLLYQHRKSFLNK